MLNPENTNCSQGGRLYHAMKRTSALSVSNLPRRQTVAYKKDKRHNLRILEAGRGSRCFPLLTYYKIRQSHAGRFESDSGWIKRKQSPEWIQFKAEQVFKFTTRELPSNATNHGVFKYPQTEGGRTVDFKNKTKPKKSFVRMHLRHCLSKCNAFATFKDKTAH